MAFLAKVETSLYEAGAGRHRSMHPRLAFVGMVVAWFEPGCARPHTDLASDAALICAGKGTICAAATVAIFAGAFA